MKEKTIWKPMAILLAVILCFSFHFALPVSADYENTHVNTGNQATDLVEVARTQVGYHEGTNNYTKYNVWFGSLNDYGYNYAWCQTFVAWCANQAGIPTSMIPRVSGTVSGMDFFKKNGTWKDAGITPEKGDIIYLYSKSSSGYHVGIVADVSGGQISTIEGNSSDRVAERSYSVGNSSIVGYGCPEYVEPNPKKWYENYECPDLGTDFYAYIINTQAWKMLTNESDNNIDIQSEIAQANQVWKFTRKDDGSYKIINCATSRALDSQGTSESGANVYTYEDSNNDPQSWYIYGESGAYYLRSKCTDCTMDVSGGSTEDGANVQMYTYNGSSAQKFQIWKLNSPSSVHVHGAAGSSYIPTTIWWTESANCTAYNIRIWNGKIWEGEPYKTIWNITDTSYEIFLPAGYYEIYIDAINYFTYTMSENVLSLTVSNGEPVDIGTNIYAYIINYKPWLSLVDQQRNVTVQKQSAKNALWCFERQNDGSYLIQNIATKKYLDYDDKNIITSDNNGNESQKWYIYGRWSGEYFIKPKNADTILTVAGDTCTYENPTILSDLTWSENQKFSIYSFEGEELQRLLDTLYTPGDLNQDGTLSLTDLIPLQQSLLRQTTLTADEAQLADYNGDGNINVLDLMLLKRVLLS